MFVGARGHHYRCHEIRAYDLATGAAYVASSCNGIGIQTDASGNGSLVTAAGGIQVEAGSLPLDALREAALATLLSSEVEEGIQREQEYFRLPADITVQWFHDGSLQFGSLGGGAHSGQTRLTWRWVRGRRVATGTITWPDSYHAGEDAADRLIQIAELRFSAGCVPARLPRALSRNFSPDREPERDMYERLTDALRAARPRLCRER